jgi:hypothetical protein
VKENVRNYGEIVMTLKELIADMYWEYDRMSSSGQETLDKIAKKIGVETNQELEQRLSKMSKEEMKQELERS